MHKLHIKGLYLSFKHSYLFFSQSGAASVQSPPAAVLPVPPVAPETVEPADAPLAVEPADAPEAVEPADEGDEEDCPKTKLKLNKERNKIQKFNFCIVLIF